MTEPLTLADDGFQNALKDFRYDQGTPPVEAFTDGWRAAMRQIASARAEVGRLKELLDKNRSLWPVHRPEYGDEQSWIKAIKAETNAALAQPPSLESDHERK